MQHKNGELASLLQTLDIGSSIAELDELLEVARVETSAFTDLLSDRVDLIPGTKGSGKSALFRIIVDFLPKMLLRSRKVVVAHGVQSPGDPVFRDLVMNFRNWMSSNLLVFGVFILYPLLMSNLSKAQLMPSI